MRKQLFNELVESIREAGQIHRGEIQPSREFVIQSQDVRAIREKEFAARSKKRRRTSRHES
jgi:putative transcriptional regulator